MAKKTESDGTVRGPRRRRLERGARPTYQWGEVDDQEQDDLIEPVVLTKRKSKSSVRRHDHDVNTLFVSNGDDPFALAKKRKPIKQKQAEDYASFVADVDPNEDDPYAIPSYGSTTLTQDDKELVEELSEIHERVDRPRRSRQSRSARDERVAESESETPTASERPSRKPRAEKASKPVQGKGASAKSEPDQKPDASQPEPVPAAPERVASPAPKRSIFTKIKEAASGLAATVAAAEAAAAAAEPTVLSPNRLAELTRGAQKVLDASGVSTNLKLDASNQSQLEVLANVVEALLNVNLTLLDRVNSVAAPTAPCADEKPSRQRSSRQKSEPRQTASPVVTVEESPTVDSESDAAPRRSRREKRVEEVVVEEKPSRRASRREVEEDVAEADLFAFWENIDDDDFAEPSSEQKTTGSVDRGRNEDEFDFDESVEVESKKKSSPKRRRASASSELTAVVEREGEGSLEPFGALQLKKKTLKALHCIGYSAPTPIQSGTIPTIQTGVDVMGQARTGTGKTAAFMIPIIEGVAECARASNGSPLALAVVPTRELAVQVRDEAQRIAQFYNLSIAACYGGKPLASQVEKLRHGVDILVGTPGRIIDLINRCALSLDNVRWVVLDEADRMLDIGFRPDVEKILRRTPRTRQTLLFSATLAPPVVSLAKSYMKDPQQFDFSPNDVSAETIEQFYLTVDQDRKFDALVKLLQLQDPHQAIVFCRTKRHVDVLARRLGSKFDRVEAIHGDLAQSKRDHIMRDFRSEKTRFLVATDVIGRGIDVSSVSHIVNFDVPQYCDDYVHRVGRTGRMGREGVAFTLVTTEEGSELTRIEIRIGRQLDRYELPDFEAFSRPSETTMEQEAVHKPVYGRMNRRVRRAL